MKIVYFHGFASSGDGDKAVALRKRFDSANVLAPDLPPDPRDVQTMIDPLLGDLAAQPVILVGTSLGGFYASYFSQRWSMPCVLVNPSISRPGR